MKGFHLHTPHIPSLSSSGVDELVIPFQYRHETSYRGLTRSVNCESFPYMQVEAWIFSASAFLRRLVRAAAARVAPHDDAGPDAHLHRLCCFAHRPHHGGRACLLAARWQPAGHGLLAGRRTCWSAGVLNRHEPRYAPIAHANPTWRQMFWCLSVCGRPTAHAKES